MMEVMIMLFLMKIGLLIIVVKMFLMLNKIVMMW